jgi:hypothetical protein
MNGVELSELDIGSTEVLQAAVISATAETVHLAEEQSVYTTPTFSGTDSLDEVQTEFSITVSAAVLLEALLVNNATLAIDTTSSLIVVADTFASQLFTDFGSVLTMNILSAVADSVQYSRQTVKVLTARNKLTAVLGIGEIRVDDKPTVVAYIVTLAPTALPSNSPHASAAPTSSPGGTRESVLSFGAVAAIAVCGAFGLCLTCCIGSCMHDKSRRILLSCIVVTVSACGVAACINRRDRSRSATEYAESGSEKEDSRADDDVNLEIGEFSNEFAAAASIGPDSPSVISEALGENWCSVREQDNVAVEC